MAKNTSPGTLRLLALLVGLTGLAAPPALAGTLENMERERALVVEALLDPELAPGERHTRVETVQPRLVDLERMVLRDDDLVGRNTPAVQRAFENYDLTFLIHTSVEQNLSLSDLWLQEIGVSTQALMTAKFGRR